MHLIDSKLFFSVLFIVITFSGHNEPLGLKYKINSPEVCNLADNLTEISGLTYDTDRDCFYAINDEEGIIFSIDQGVCNSNVIVNFKEDGDYEGIEKVGNHIYVLESSGDLLKYNIEKEKITKKYSTHLDSHNDSEGLALDPKTNSLLIACKGDDRMDKKDSNEDIHAIYRFDLDKKELIRKPWMLIKDKDLLEYYESTLTNFKWLRSKIAEDRFYSFAPSAVAINPIDDKVYILSTRGKLLVVMTRDQKVNNVYFLENSAYIQPEGLAFDPEGNMFISNEGKDYHGNVLKIANKRG